MNIVVGDIITMTLEGKFDVIVHGCNCFCTMGAGLALKIARHFPEAVTADKNTRRGDANKLGQISYASIQRNGRDLWVVNAYTQYGYGHGKNNVSLVAVRRSFRTVSALFGRESELRIAYPAIGAGLGGGNWNEIYPIICEELDGCNHTFVKFDSRK